MDKKDIFSYRITRLLLLCVTIILVEPLIFTIKSQQSKDSIEHILSQTKKLEDQIKILQDFAKKNKGTPNELFCLKRLMDISVKMGSTESYYQTLIDLAGYYSYTEQMDSLMTCLSLADSMDYEQGETSTALFDIQSHICQYYIVNGDYEIAMNEAASMKMKAEKTGKKENIVYANMNIGLIYLFINRYLEAIPFFEKSLSLSKEIKDHNFGFELSLNSYLTYVYWHAGEQKKMQQTLNYYKSALEKDTTLTEKRRNAAFCSIYSYYVNYYISAGQLESAGNAADSATTYMDTEHGVGFTSVYYLAMARYCRVIAEYGKALDYINKAFKVDPSLEVAEEKMNIQEAAGKIDEALTACGEAIKLIEDQNTAAYSRQLDRLHILHGLNEETRQTQLLQDQKSEIAQRQMLLIAFLLTVCILIVFLAGTTRSLLKARKLKNTLENDRNILKVSTEDLRMATERAEKANLMKTQFVANVSHEIRTPLNAIVGFSALLNDVTKEEQADFISIINTNTDLLLKLVNDVLDLSILENDSFPLDIRNANLDSCCQQALESVKQKTQQGVRLTFTHPDTSLSIQTDASRLSQLLFNLLVNSAKYTENGEINLDYRVDETFRMVIFTVTDTGCGIPLDKQQVIFNRFVKVDDFKQGAGLGLSICCEIAKRLGGTLSVDPSYTSGVRFIFKLPIAG